MLHGCHNLLEQGLITGLNAIYSLVEVNIREVTDQITRSQTNPVSWVDVVRGISCVCDCSPYASSFIIIGSKLCRSPIPNTTDLSQRQHYFFPGISQTQTQTHTHTHYYSLPVSLTHSLASPRLASPLNRSQPSKLTTCTHILAKMSEILINDQDFQGLKGKVVIVTGTFAASMSHPHSHSLTPSLHFLPLGPA